MPFVEREVEDLTLPPVNLLQLDPIDTNVEETKLVQLGRGDPESLCRIRGRGNGSQHQPRSGNYRIRVSTGAWV